jgi:hypothetical protein
MIKFQATNPENGRKILGLGLSHGNLERLKEGQPIHFNAEEMHLPEMRFNEVLIYVGETEDSMRRDLADHGYLDAATVVVEERKRQ